MSYVAITYFSRRILRRNFSTARILIIIFLLTVPTPHLYGELVRWEIAEGGNGHWYGAFQETNDFGAPLRLTWEQAKVAAQARGGHLATLTSAAENNFAFELVSDHQFWSFFAGRTWGPWLGAFQPPETVDPAADWRWVTGEPFAFTAWEDGEPNQFSGFPENHLIFFAFTNPAATWNDAENDASNYHPGWYLVEFPIPEPSTAFLTSIGAIAIFPRRQSRVPCSRSNAT